MEHVIGHEVKLPRDGSDNSSYEAIDSGSIPSVSSP